MGVFTLLYLNKRNHRRSNPWVVLEDDEEGFDRQT